MALPRVAVARWQSVSRDYVEIYHQRLREAGLEPLDLGPGHSLEGCAGLLLIGGVDVDPSLYGEERGPHTDLPERGRDAFELALLDAALSGSLPVLAICRGAQLLNVCLGGSLVQHVDDDSHRWQDEAGRVSRWHEIEVIEDSRLASAIGDGRQTVNSRHHQGITPERMAKGLRATAVSKGGFVEAIEPDVAAWTVGVQWHPERQEGEDAFRESSKRLFWAFARSVAAV